MFENQLNLTDLKRRINDLLRYFKKETNSISCSLIDTEGFVIAQELDEEINKYSFLPKLLKLIEQISEMDSIDLNEKTQTISFKDEELLGNHTGFLIHLKKISEELILVSVNKLKSDEMEVKNKFKQLTTEFKVYFESKEIKLLDSSTTKKDQITQKEKHYNLV